MKKNDLTTLEAMKRCHDNVSLDAVKARILGFVNNNQVKIEFEDTNEIRALKLNTVLDLTPGMTVWIDYDHRPEKRGNLIPGFPVYKACPVNIPDEDQIMPVLPSDEELEQIYPDWL